MESNSLSTIIEETGEEVGANAVDDELQTLLDADAKQLANPKAEQLANEPADSNTPFSRLNTNIVSINGNTPFHAMGLIKVASCCATVDDD